MTIQEAIEVLRKELEGRFINDPHELARAQQLGIEALRRIRHMRDTGLYVDMPLLTGETESPS